MATNLPWHPLPPSRTKLLYRTQRQFIPIRHVTPVQAFRRSDFDMFARRVTSGEALRDAWRRANDGFEQFVFETKKTAERIDRRYSVSQRLNAAAQSTIYRAREIDREFEITDRWRSLTLDFSRNWPRYRKQLSNFLDTPIGKTFSTIFFVWFALSGWLFQFLIIALWVLPFAAPLLIGAVAKNLVIQGECPACRKQFVGYKNQTIRCTSCRNIVWQPQGDFFSGGGRGTKSSKSQPDVIDVEFEEK